MQYLMLVRVDPELADTTTVGDVAPWVEEGARRGLRVQGAAVEPPETARTVRVRGGETLLSDGPFLETKEYVAGLDVLSCETLDEALELAAAHPLARFHMVEVRPFWGG